MAKARTEDEIREIVEGFGYELLDWYVDRYRKKVIIKDTFGYKADVELYSLKINNGIFNFICYSNPFSLENMNLWLETHNKTFKLSDNNNNKYLHNNELLYFYCKKCKEIFSSIWTTIQNKNSECPYCNGRRVGKYNNLEYLFPELAEEWVRSKNNKFPNEVVTSTNELVLWKCKICNYEWWTKIGNRTNQNQGCPKCSESLTESKIATELKRYILQNYNAETEYKIFRNPKTNRYLPFDIYIHNSIFIEIHGRQHYQNDKHFFKTQEEFEYRQYLDQLKKEYAEQNGIYIEIDLRNIKTIEQAIQYVEDILHSL